MPRHPDTTKKERYHDPFPARLRELIKDRGIGQEELARVLGFSSRQSVTGYIDGSTLPTSDKLVALADFFDVSADYLLGLSDVQTKDKKVASICDYVGLQEKAVEVLRLLSDIRPGIMNRFIAEYGIDFASKLEKMAEVSEIEAMPERKEKATTSLLVDSKLRDITATAYDFELLCREVASSSGIYDLIEEYRTMRQEVIRSELIAKKYFNDAGVLSRSIDTIAKEAANGEHTED